MLSNLQDVAIKEAIDGHNLVITDWAGRHREKLSAEGTFATT